MTRLTSNASVAPLSLWNISLSITLSILITLPEVDDTVTESSSDPQGFVQRLAVGAGVGVWTAIKERR